MLPRRSDTGSHTVDGEHPQGGLTDQTAVVSCEGACGGEQNFHAPAGQSADEKITSAHMRDSSGFRLCFSISGS